MWALIVKEWKLFLDSLLSYLMLTIFLLLSGLFTWLVGQDIFLINQATLRPFFLTAYWTLFFFIPALTMRAFAEEKRTGTIEWLLTRPLSDWTILFAKYLAILGLIILALFLTLPYYITLTQLAQEGKLDHGMIAGGYLGLLLISMVYTAWGLFASSLTNNQVVAFLLALAMTVLFHLVFGLFAAHTSGILRSVFQFLDLSWRFQALARGILDLRDLLVFLAYAFIGLLATELVLLQRHLSGQR